LGMKYYVYEWELYVNAINYIYCDIHELCTNDEHLLTTLKDALSRNYLQCLRESCVQRLIKHDNKVNIKMFVSNAIKHTIVTCLNGSWEGITTDNINANIILQIAERHLLSHYKYYIMTRIMNIF